MNLKTTSHLQTDLDGWLLTTAKLLGVLLVFAILGLGAWITFQSLYVAAGGQKPSVTSLSTTAKTDGRPAGADASGTSESTDPPPTEG